MAASSPVLSNGGSVTLTTAVTIPTTATNASKNLRGLNKPKCIECGNVARSRCPYQSCKSCCAKAQNPCHIHVLKSNSTFPDKSPSLSSPLFDLQSNEVSSSGNPLRAASLRQLSNNFAQFNNLPTPLRSRKLLTRKDAVVLNEWRFLKLKEFKDCDIEAENEAFDRYIQNVDLLEEVLSVNSGDCGYMEDGFPTLIPNSTFGEGQCKTITGLKLRLGSNPIRTENFRKRMRYIVDQGLKKLSKVESDSESCNFIDQDELEKRPKKAKSWQAERVSALADLIDKLNKARNEEDLRTCLEMKSQLFNSHTKSEVEPQGIEISDVQPVKNVSSPNQHLGYSQPKWVLTTNIDSEILSRVDAHFSSLEEIEDL